ncbi:MAG: C1 family peptidase [Bacteroidales bacterium]|nr:C1 family peptidase [Bacteroidales bacterium]
MKQLPYIWVVFLHITLFSQHLTNEILQEIRKKYEQSSPNQGLINALYSNELNKIVVNQKNRAKPDDYFTYKVKTYGITDQKSSGRCWMFAGLNTLRPRVIEKYNLKNFEFSYNFLFFYDLLEKANLFLESIIQTSDKPLDDKKVEWLLKNPISDGGTWAGLAHLIEKYGLIPAEIMPENFSSNNTRGLISILSTYLRQEALSLREMAEKKAKKDDIQKAKILALSNVYKILAYHLGEPPKNFTYRFIDKDGKASSLKSYDPISFRDEVLPNFKAQDYIMFMNDPSRPYFKLYEIDLDRNIYEGFNWKYINLPIEEIKKMAIEALKNNVSLYYSCDVGKQIDKNEGLLDLNNYDYFSLYGIPFIMDKKQRIITFESGSTHGMNLIAVDILDNKPVKWLVENSWGSTGKNGNLLITDAWFNEYTFRIVIPKEFVPEDILKIWKEKPILLPPWDPMFSMDE